MTSAKEKRVSPISLFDSPPDAYTSTLSRRTAGVKAWIEAKPGAEGHVFTPRLLASVLRKDYAGVGHRSHLDRRFWISVRLDADVPLKEIRRLISLSYDLVCTKLTAKQRTALARLACSP